MVTIPDTVADVTAEWLAGATRMPITSAELSQIGVGVGVSSAVYRARCAGEGCPASMIVKLPALDEAAVFTSTMLRMYIREVRFFDELAEQSPIRVPRGYFGAVDEETSRFVVVMEDMAGMRIVDQNQGMSLHDAETSVDELAKWHARWWGEAELIAERGTAVSLADPVYPAVLPIVFAEGWEKLRSELEHIPEPLEAVAPGWVDAMPGMLSDLATAPTTLTHGDYRADNILFDADGNVALLDFQLTGVGSGSYDLAYFVTQSLDPQTASSTEAALFERYVAALVAEGVSEADTARLWATTAPPPCSASCTRWWPAVGWTSTTRASGCWSTTCSSASLGPSTSSRSPTSWRDRLDRRPPVRSRARPGPCAPEHGADVADPEPRGDEQVRGASRAEDRDDGDEWRRIADDERHDPAHRSGGEGSDQDPLEKLATDPDPADPPRQRLAQQEELGPGGGCGPERDAHGSEVEESTPEVSAVSRPIEVPSSTSVSSGNIRIRATVVPTTIRTAAMRAGVRGSSSAYRAFWRSRDAVVASSPSEYAATTIQTRRVAGGPNSPRWKSAPTSVSPIAT